MQVECLFVGKTWWFEGRVGFVSDWLTKIMVEMLRTRWASTAGHILFQSFISGFLKSKSFEAPKLIFRSVFSLVAMFETGLFYVVILYFWGDLFCSWVVMLRAHVQGINFLCFAILMFTSTWHVKWITKRSNLMQSITVFKWFLTIFLHNCFLCNPKLLDDHH